MIIRTADVGRNHNTVAWLHDPTADTVSDYSAEQQGVDLIRLGLALVALRAAAGSVELDYRREYAPYSQSEPIAYPIGWISVHASGDTSLRGLELLQDRIAAG